MRFAMSILVGLILVGGPDLSARELPSRVDFARHVVPTLYRLGCSAGTCHGAFSGQQGFRLSLFASRPEIDHANIRGAMGGRINALHPDQSLLLRKPSEDGIGHGGGQRFEINSDEYRLLRQWLVAGAVFERGTTPQITNVRRA